MPATLRGVLGPALTALALFERTAETFATRTGLWDAWRDDFGDCSTRWLQCSALRARPPRSTADCAPPARSRSITWAGHSGPWRVRGYESFVTDARRAERRSSSSTASTRVRRRTSFARIFSRSRRAHRSIAFDLVGCGLSAMPALDYSADLFVDQIVDARRRLPARRARSSAARSAPRSRFAPPLRAGRPCRAARR